MGLFDRLRALLGSLSPVNPWPAIDVTLPGKRYLHLVGSIHMGTRGYVAAVGAPGGKSAARRCADR
ncbi:putative ligase [Atlantibacter hermannii]|nr:putative ligase [Atlantibacter hermannii]